MSKLNVESISDGVSTIHITNTLKGNPNAWGQMCSDGVLLSSFNIASIADMGDNVLQVRFVVPMKSTMYTVVTGTSGNCGCVVGNKTPTGFELKLNVGSEDETSQTFDFMVNGN